MSTTLKNIYNCLQICIIMLISTIIGFHASAQAPHTCDFQPGNPTSNDSQICFYSDHTTLMGCVWCQVTGQQIKCGAADDAYVGSYFKVTYTGLTCYAPGVPLGVELLYFNALLEDEGVLCFWSTASESNNDYFILEKSLDGLNFDSLAVIKGIGNSNSKSDYNYMDYNPERGITYYKITQVDLDGKKTYYNPISVKYIQPEIFSIRPNPNNSGLFIYSSSKSIDQIKISSSIGKTFYMNSPTQSSSIDLSQYSEGTYFLTILYSNGDSETSKIVYAK